MNTEQLRVDFTCYSNVTSICSAALECQFTLTRTWNLSNLFSFHVVKSTMIPKRRYVDDRVG